MDRLALGSIFANRYEILALVGRGGMGQVYRANDLVLDRVVAIKVLHADLDGLREQRFEREAHALARLDHAGCVRIVDYGRADGRAFIAMEMLAGESLSALLAREVQLSVTRAVYLADKLLAALAHAHDHGVWHRDLKPANVVIVSSGGGVRPVLVDFGLAFLQGDAALTQEGHCVGSPSYVAPERIGSRQCDARADLYAVGVLLYEMLAGACPFVGSTAQEILQAALEKPPRPLRALRPDVPPSLEAAIMRALQKDPARRFASAADLRAALADATVQTDEDDHDPAASTLIELAIARVSLWARMWSWLRYGRWRWL